MSKLSEKILELHNNGYSYNEIVETLNCSKGTVAYHCGNGQKEKTNKRNYKFKKKDPLMIKKTTFLLSSDLGESFESSDTELNVILNKKITEYSRAYKDKKSFRMFTIQQLRDKIGENPKCYLTGRPIDLFKPSTYSLDHIIPRSKGGDNSLDNCDIACNQANKAKGDMMLDEFYKLCSDVLKNKN